MYSRKLTTYLALVCLSIAFVSCTKDGTAGAAGPIGPTGATGPSFVGAIQGHVSLFDQYGSRVLTGLKNVQLVLSGHSVPVDSNGHYILGSLATGAYTISASNAGYGSTYTNNFQFLADTLNRDIKLSAIPNFSPTAFSAYPVAAGGSDSLVLTFPTDSRARNCIVFLNSSSTVGSTPSKYLLAYNKAIAANSTKPTTIIIPAQDLANVGIATGATVYAIAYGYVVSDGSAYEDIATGKIVYTAVSSASLTTTFTAP